MNSESSEEERPQESQRDAIERLRDQKKAGQFKEKSRKDQQKGKKEHRRKKIRTPEHSRVPLPKPVCVKPKTAPKEKGREPAACARQKIASGSEGRERRNTSYH